MIGIRKYSAGIGIASISLLGFLISPDLTAQVPSEVLIEGIPWIPQTWNNCGPATLSMALGRWGVQVSQDEIADLIRPERNDGHVSVEQIRDAARSFGAQSFYIPSGSTGLLKELIAGGYPVMIPTWHIDTPGNQMGHYRLIHGFSDDSDTFAIRDSLEEIGYIMDQTELDILWRVFNRRMIVVFLPSDAGGMAEVAERSLSPLEVLERSLETAAAENRQPPDVLPDGMTRSQYLAYGDFNRAMALTSLGRWSDAAAAARTAFDRGLPWRMLWYQPEILESLYRTGDHDRVIERTTRALNPYPYLEELWYWRGMSESAIGDTDSAVQSFRKALDIRPGWNLPGAALASIESPAE